MKKQKDNGFEYNSLIVFSLSMIANVLGMVFQSLVGRLLNDVSLFADLQSIMSLFNILVLPTTVATGVVTKYIAQFHSQHKYGEIKDFLQKVCLVLGIVTFLYIVIMLCLKNYISDGLHINDLSVVIVAIVLSGITTMSSVFIGGLQGMQLFVLYGLFGVVVPIFKIVAVFTSLAWDNHLLVILVVWIVGTVVSHFVAALFLKYSLKSYSHNKCTVDCKELMNYVYSLFIANVGFTLLTNIDMLLVKHNYNSEAGEYSVALMLGKIVTYVTGALVVVLFPMVAGGQNTEKYKLALLRKTIIGNIVLGVIVLAFVNVFSSVCIHILLGNTFLSCTQYLLPISCYVLPQGLINILVTYSMANNDMKFITKSLLIAIALEIVVTINSGIGLNVFIWYIVGITWLSAIINIIHIYRRVQKNT